MTRAPSPCSADSSSEASAKEEATQGKPTDDARLTEIRADAGANRRYGWDIEDARFLLRLHDGLLAALRAAQAERDGAEALALSNEDAGRLTLASSIRQTLRADDAERERDALRQRRHKTEHASYNFDELVAGFDGMLIRLKRVEAERDALREALEQAVKGIQAWCDAVENDSSWDGWDHHYKAFAYHGGLEYLCAALVPRPPCSAASSAKASEAKEATQGKPVKEE